MPVVYILWARKQEVPLLNLYEDKGVSSFAFMLTIRQSDSVCEEERSFTSNAHYIFNYAAKPRNICAVVPGGMCMWRSRVSATVPTQVGTLTQVVTSVHLGRSTSTPIFLLTHLMPFSTRLGTQCFKMRLGMVGLLSAVNQILK